MNSLLYKVLSIPILLGLLVFNYVIILVSANAIESRINEEAISSVEIVSMGAETTYAYRYGESTILIAIVNPNVLFSYRNIHVVPKIYIGFSDIYRRVSESSPSIVTLYSRLNAVGERLVASGLGDLDLRVEGQVYVADLSGKPIDRVAKAIGEVFGDLNVTVIVLDERLLGLRKLYLDKGVIAFFREIPDFNSDYWRTFNKTVSSLIADLVNSNCFCYVGGHGITTSRIDGHEYPFLLAIDIPGNYEECREIIEKHIVELADFIRNYIPEDIPLYIDISERPSICGIKLLPGTINTTIQMPSREHSSPDSETQRDYSLLYIATTASILVLGVIAYSIFKRLRK
jgi:hypothetical protein